jgi:hypothetical protein
MYDLVYIILGFYILLYFSILKLRREQELAKRREELSGGEKFWS